jgi:hypothetical protein
MGRTGIIPAITWKAFEGKSDQLGVIARLQGVLFVKLDAQGGEVGRLFVPFIVTATRFGARRFCWQLALFHRPRALQ